MSKRRYTHVQMLLPEIQSMVESGKTERKISEHYGSIGRGKAGIWGDNKNCGINCRNDVIVLGHKI